MRGKRPKKDQQRADLAAKQRRVNSLVQRGSHLTRENQHEAAAACYRRAHTIIANNPGVQWPT